MLNSNRSKLCQPIPVSTCFWGLIFDLLIAYLACGCLNNCLYNMEIIMYIDHIEGRYTNNRNKINKKGANSMKVFASFASFDYPKPKRVRERERKRQIISTRTGVQFRMKKNLLKERKRSKLYQYLLIF